MRRNQLAHIAAGGWSAVTAVSAFASSEATAACLLHWQAHRLPLVVTRQPEVPVADFEQVVALGLPAPLQWGRKPIALRAPARVIERLEHFPSACGATALLPAAAQQGFAALCSAFRHAGISARVYGGYGWQLLTGLPYLRAESDIDLSLEVADEAQADEAARLLSTTPVPHIRIDAELSFPHGQSVAAREWQRWRAGDVAQILVRTLHSVTLQSATQWEKACIAQ